MKKNKNAGTPEKTSAAMISGLKKKNARLERANRELTSALKARGKDGRSEHKAEKLLRESEQKYRELVESANSIILRWTRDGRITFLNEFGLKYFGYKAEELLGRHVMDTIVPRTDSGGRDLGPLMDRILADPAAFEQNVNENLRRNGERVWIAWTNRLVKDARGRIIEILSIGTDITQSKLAQESIKRSETQLSLILNNVSDVVFAITVEPGGSFRFGSVNRRFLEVTGLKEEQIVGKPAAEVIPPPAHALVFGKYREAIESGQPVRWDEESNYPAGKKIGHVTLVPVFDERGNCAQLIGMVHDITELKRDEEAIRELNRNLERRVAERTAELAVAKDRAEAADRLKSAFLATMSHELRTPLNSIIGFTGILRQELPGPLNEEQKKQLGMIGKSSEHLLGLINDVLDISKIEAGQMQIVNAPFDLRAAIRQAVLSARPLAEKKGLRLEEEIAPGTATITADRHRVEQVLLNLLSNAIKFTDKGSVRAACALENGNVRITVSDTGIGIRKEHLGELFKPFRQIDAGPSRQYEGTGLGLSICKRLLELMGGSIRVESEWGKGSAFSILLPSGKREK